ncbi:Alpha/Beta hydrolase protein [Obelidium mucronatum]|nr:Alpha/Beta hydrolase protein [Obelidium mucronatum]
MDWRGHGRTVFRNSNGVKGFHESFDQVFADMLQLLAIEVPGMRPGIPTFVAGHSMGGLLALSFVHHYKLQIPQLRGVIAQAPALSPGTPVPWWLQLIVKWIGGTWFGRFTQANNLALDGLCSYEPVVRQYLRDPLVHARISLRLAKDMLVHSEILKRLARQFSTPVIVYHSARDQYTRADASEDWVIACGSKDKRFFGFPDDRVEHEIHNEPSVRDRIIRDYTAWILERSK